MFCADTTRQDFASLKVSATKGMKTKFVQMNLNAWIKAVTKDIPKPAETSPKKGSAFTMKNVLMRINNRKIYK